jgi:hypothetical protein
LHFLLIRCSPPEHPISPKQIATVRHRALSHRLNESNGAFERQEDCMAHLVLQYLFSSEDVVMGNGMWIFLAVGAVALFGIFLPSATWMEHRRKEREAFYKAENIRRIAEAPGEGSQTALQLLREEERIKRIKSREGLKIGGLINIGVGLGLIIFLRALIGSNEPVYLCGLIPGFIGVAMIVYVYVMASPIE